MIQISSLNNSYNQSFGNANVTKKVSKAVTSVPREITGNKNNTKTKAVSLGALLTALFASNKVKEAQNENNLPKKEKIKNGYREEKIYDEKGRVTNILKYSNADDVLSINIYLDENTGNIQKKDFFKKNGKGVQYTEKYNQNGKKTEAYAYFDGTNQVKWKELYEKRQDIPTVATWFNKQGKMTEQVVCNRDTGDLQHRFVFDNNGKLEQKVDVSELTGNTIRRTNYYKNGSKRVQEFDIVTGKQLKQFDYDKNNRVTDMSVAERNTVGDLKKYLEIEKKQEKTDEFETVPKKNGLSEVDKRKIEDFLYNRLRMEQSE